MSRKTLPNEFVESKSSGRCDVSRNSRLARSDMELSPNDIEMRANDIELSRPVDFVSHPVDFRSVLAASANRVVLDVTDDTSSRYGKNPRNKSAICDRKVAF